MSEAAISFRESESKVGVARKPNAAKKGSKQ